MANSTPNGEPAVSGSAAAMDAELGVCMKPHAGDPESCDRCGYEPPAMNADSHLKLTVTQRIAFAIENRKFGKRQWMLSTAGSRWEPRDCWLGLFWQRPTKDHLTLYFVLFPCRVMEFHFETKEFADADW